MTTRSLIVLTLALTLTACGDKEGDSGGEEEVDCSSEGFVGASLYTTNCAGCHVADGSGATGPSLILAVPQSTDADITQTINDGGSTMPAFEGTLSCGEQKAVLEYLRDQHGDEGGT
jgi:mono/diheme cytochrome c family protein